MKISIVTGIPWQRGQTQAEAYQAAIAQAEWAEALGFDSVWTTVYGAVCPWRHARTAGFITWAVAGQPGSSLRRRLHS